MKDRREIWSLKGGKKECGKKGRKEGRKEWDEERRETELEEQRRKGEEGKGKGEERRGRGKGCSLHCMPSSGPCGSTRVPLYCL